ncbi:MAG TPA: hypothetical protein VK821_19595, partial [Dehalococcoidia bacterium]|nr:hypothetical protein [Dehalococcoidia bacterium]
DLLDGPAARRVGLDGAACAALVLLEGTQTAVAGQTQRLAQVAAAASLRIDTIERTDTLEGDVVDGVWREWLALARIDDLADGEALLTVSTSPTEAVRAVRTLSDVGDMHGAAVACWARAGNGVVYGRIAAPPERAAHAIAAVQAQLMQEWPATTVASGAPAVQRALQPWGKPPATIDLMRALKQRFDPNRTLQAGRYVGGI